MGMVIIGAGEAGARAALELRKLGWAGSITLIGGEQWHPYERPPLSKRQLCEEETSMPVAVLSENVYKEHDIQFISSCHAVGIDRQVKQVELSDGSRLGYEKLLLATGANARKLSVQGDARQDIMVLRTYADALAIRQKLIPGNHVAVIGGGFIGLEVASSAVTKGCKVTLIEVAPRILMRGVPEEIARIVAERHRKAGVTFRIGVMLEHIDRDGDGYVISMADGSTVRCDAVIAGVGAVPETTLAVACGLEIENGIKVDGMLATSDPNIFAAGDCCSFPHPLYGGQRIRLEAYRNAQDQGLHVAKTMLGESESFAAIPWFWSDQYELTLQVAGLADGSVVTVHRDLGESGSLYFHLDGDGRLVAVSGIGADGGIAKEFRLAEMLVERQAKPDPMILSDPSRRLKELLR